jgi:hypothetical protein
LLWLLWRWGLVNYLPGLASNSDPPNLSLPSNWDYKCATCAQFDGVFLLFLSQLFMGTQCYLVIV